jgi:two-component system, NarL family, response regulator NreC
LAKSGKLHHVLIADDQLLFRTGLRTLLAAESDIRITAETSTVSQTLAIRLKTAPEVVLVGFSLLCFVSADEKEQLRVWGDTAALILVADPKATEVADLAAEIGCSTLLPRDTPPLQIVRIIRRAALNREQSSAERSQTAADLQALAGAHTDRSPALTSREQEVVRFLAEGRTVRETAEELALSAKTIEAHKLNVMRKLDIHNRHDLIEYAIAKGLVAPLPA